MLKFIAPSEKMQRVSYVWHNGSINDVKVHVPLVWYHSLNKNKIIIKNLYKIMAKIKIN